MRLRRRLTLAMAVFLVIGLAVTDVVTYTSLRSFLYGRLDSQLDSSQRLAVRYLVHTHLLGHPARENMIDLRVSQDVYVTVLAPDGVTLVTRPSGSPQPDPRPVVPRSVRLAPAAGPGRGTFRPNPDDFNLESRSGVAYRAQAAAVPQGTVVSAIRLSQTDATLSSLVRIELGVSIVVLLALCGLGLWTVRRGLRPLDAMAETAGAIASGDLSRRVDVADGSTEVGKLGNALNTMLARIEAAFTEKSTSEARLRQFVADASHELRTPLTSIRGYSELLRKGALSDSEERDRALRRVEHEAERMGGLVDDLLLLARLDQGRLLDRAPVDLRRICRDAVDDASLADPGRPVRLAAPLPIVVAGDRDRLAQVAHNLVRNALVHTPVGTPVLVEVFAAHGMGVVRVTDQGPGLAPDQVSRVFDRFYRGDPSRTGQGTGLGLSIVQAIAAALGGRAWATSDPGRGAVFAVELPLTSAPGTGDSGGKGLTGREQGRSRSRGGPQPEAQQGPEGPEALQGPAGEREPEAPVAPVGERGPVVPVGERGPEAPVAPEGERSPAGPRHPVPASRERGPA
ncbi:MAG: ATP-binding protein [Acidimicrobiales bacterium]